MYDANSNTLWCDIAKCGSTTYVFTVFKELYLKAGFKINVSVLFFFRSLEKCSGDVSDFQFELVGTSNLE